MVQRTQVRAGWTEARAEVSWNDTWGKRGATDRTGEPGDVWALPGSQGQREEARPEKAQDQVRFYSHPERVKKQGACGWSEVEPTWRGRADSRSQSPEQEAQAVGSLEEAPQDWDRGGEEGRRRADGSGWRWRHEASTLSPAASGRRCGIAGLCPAGPAGVSAVGLQAGPGRAGR